ncbi:hypothetical protein K6U59_12175, partial [Vibrio vulnificus]|uniref:hypothetical protein n=2 Tax=Vibrio vulnificus TaxID=672 RepID=UPI001EEB8CD4
RVNLKSQTLFQIYFSGTYLNFSLAEALRYLPCQWMRIIGSFFTCTRAKLEKKEKSKSFACFLLKLYLKTSKEAFRLF